MKSTVRSAALNLISLIAPHIPLSVYRTFSPRNPLGFFYHVISDTPVPHIEHLYPVKTSNAFEQDLIWLKENTSPIGYPELVAHFSSGQKLPQNAAFISFDDGFRQCYDVVYPLLLKHEVPCIFFLTTDWIDNRTLFFRSKISLALNALAKLSPEKRKEALANLNPGLGSPLGELEFTQWLKTHKDPASADFDGICAALGIDTGRYLAENRPYLNRAQIKEMQAGGFVFGAHSCNHTKFLLLSPDEQVRQIVDSCRVVQEITGSNEVPFAFPFSGENVSREMLRQLKKDHPEIGLIFDTKKLMREPDVVQRIWADKPASVDPGQNLAYWLRDGYIRLVTRNQSQFP